MEKLLKCLLDSGSQVILMQQAYFDKYFEPILGSAKGEFAEAPNLFNLIAANKESLPLTRNVELDETL